MLAQGMNPFVLTQGYSFLSMCFVLMGTVLNIVLDPLFIFTFGMGVQGSALATVLAQFLSCSLYGRLFLCTESLFHFRSKERHFSAWKGFVSIVSLGITPFVMTITECAIQIVFNINLNLATGGNKDYTAALTVMLKCIAINFPAVKWNGQWYAAVCQLQLWKGKYQTAETGHYLCYDDCISVCCDCVVHIAYDTADVCTSFCGQ